MKKESPETIVDKISEPPHDVTPETDSPSMAPKLADLLGEIESFLEKFIVLPHPSQRGLIALWIVQTYCYQEFDYCGYISIRSVVPQCGKTQLLQLISLLANGNPPITTNPTPAVLFRATRPCLLLDEVDKLGNSDKKLFGEVIAVLNAGFKRGATVERAVRASDGDYVPKAFNVFYSKAFAGLEHLTDTLADRSFLIHMEPAIERMARLSERLVKPQLDRISHAIQRWVELRRDDIRKAYESLPDAHPELRQFDDRFQDIAEPLVVLATLADEEDSGRARVQPILLKALSTAVARREHSEREQIIQGIFDTLSEFTKDGKTKFIKSMDILIQYNKNIDIDDRPPILSVKKLSLYLKDLGLGPKKGPGGRARGYYLKYEWIHQKKTRYKARWGKEVDE